MIRTYKFKLYKTKRLKHLHRLINISADIYNHSIALHKRYYRLYHKSLNKFVLQKHITKLKRLSRYNSWNELGSQAIQEITERIDKGYKKFFRHENKRPPTFKKKSKYKSFTLKGKVGYRLNGNTLTINGKKFKLWLSKEIDGAIKTLTVKRDNLGDFWLLISAEVENIKSNNHAASGKSVGIDFGLKTFLTLGGRHLGLTDYEREIQSPLYFLKSIGKIRKLSRTLSRKKKGSNNRKKARLNLARLHRKVANQRNDFFHKLSNRLASEYEYVFVENLNLKAMQMLWGRKVNDVSYGKFVNILSYKTSLALIDRFYPSSKTCYDCGYVKKDLCLKDRIWICPECGKIHHRDTNAADNIHRVGTSTLAGDTVRPGNRQVPTIAESPASGHGEYVKLRLDRYNLRLFF